jgi:1,4-alpha-glucan branching enzyme
MPEKNEAWVCLLLVSGMGETHSGGAMTLSHAVLEKLTQVRHPSPHEVLGMHPLPDGSGVVVRVFSPTAASVEIQPVHEKEKPAIRLKRVHRAGLFEGVSQASQTVYAYDVVATGENGDVSRTRDPYSFLPTVGETDLYLFGQGNERRIYDKLGAEKNRDREYG